MGLKPVDASHKSCFNIGIKFRTLVLCSGGDRVKRIISAVILASAISAWSADLNIENANIPEMLAAAEVNAPAYQGFPKIVGGTEAAAGEFPFIVSMQSSYYGHFCGGSLIAKNWVLTAAHCVDGITPSSILIGLQNQSDTSKAERFTPAKIIKHPSWDSNVMNYDYALIKLSGESKYPPVKLNTKDITGDTTFTVAGWGVTSESSQSVSKKLLKVDVPFVDQQTCSLAYPDSITDNMLCAGFKDGGKDSCQGDSGGPLVMGSGSSRVLVGVVSWGEGCARPNKYGVYSKVKNAVDWINSTMKAN